jgi:hypothetical protein
MGGWGGCITASFHHIIVCQCAGHATAKLFQQGLQIMRDLGIAAQQLPLRLP